MFVFSSIFSFFLVLPFASAAEAFRLVETWCTAEEGGSTRAHLFFCLAFTFFFFSGDHMGARPVPGLSVDSKAHNVNPYNSGLLQTSLKSPNRPKDSWLCVEH